MTSGGYRTLASTLHYQLVLLPVRGDADTAVLGALEQVHEGADLTVRDAAVLQADPLTLRAVSLADDWPGRRALGHHWWCALTEALCDVGGCTDDGQPEGRYRHIVDAGMSRSFLEEAATAIAASTTTVALVTERIDVRGLLPKLDRDAFTRVIYGGLPDAAVDELGLPDRT